MENNMLPIEFITGIVSRCWTDVGDMKATIEAIRNDFSNTAEVEEILQDLIDAQMICAGRLENFLSKKSYVEVPVDTPKDPIPVAKPEDIKEKSAPVKPAPVAAVAPKKAEPVAAVKPEDVLSPEEIASLMGGDADVKAAPAVSDEDSFIVDFDDVDVSSNKLTDDDIYDENGMLRI